MALNSLQKALVNNGFAQEPKQKKRRHKDFKCRKCGSSMIIVEDTNTMACSSDKCNNYYLFNN